MLDFMVMIGESYVAVTGFLFVCLGVVSILSRFRPGWQLESTDAE